ncbi:MAG: alpha/beta hydrolase [Candidatus Aureabacteria bacterium]|nr:alpha/beta hydrolase [Candidatus Auribacterota bacterium]
MINIIVYIKLFITFLLFFLVLRLLKIIAMTKRFSFLLRFLLIFIIFFGSIKLLVMVIERTSPYIPTRIISVTPKDFSLNWENCYFNPNDDKSLSLNGWFINSSTEKNKGTVLYCHGNAGNMENRISTAYFLSYAGYDVFLFDYRGYGKSTGTPSEKGFYADALSAYNYLTEIKNIPHQDIIFMGRSIGCSVASHLAVKKQPKALVLISPFTSAPDMARLTIIFYPLSFFMSISYDNTKNIPQIKCPLVVVHSVNDEMIPYRMGRSLFEMAITEKKLIELTQGHNDDYFERSKFVKELTDFLENLK